MALQSAEELELAKLEAELEGRPNGIARIIPLAVVAVVVFPVALGIGFMMQSTTPAPGKLAAAEHLPPDIPNNIRPVAKDPALVIIDRSKGDDLLCDGRFEAALHLYRSLGSADSLRAPPELALRIAFCQEGLGLWEEALAVYRSVASNDPQHLAKAAELGQSRIWLRLGDYAKAELLLRSILLTGGDRRILPVQAYDDVALLYSIASGEQTLASFEMPASAGLVPVCNVLEWSMTDALKWLNEKPADSSVADFVESSLQVASPIDLSADEQTPDAPDIASGTGMLIKPLRVFARQQSLEAILIRIASESGLELKWSDALKQRAAARIVDLSIRDLPVSAILTATCREIAAEWTFLPLERTFVLTESTPDSKSSVHQREMGTAALAGMIAVFPSHPLTPAAKFCMARLATADGRFTDAGQLYSSMIGRSTTPLAIRAAFNGALVYHQVGDLGRTCWLLEFVVHGAPGNELHTRSIILYGRTLMDLGDYREAAFQLKRATESRHLPEDQARACVFLAMAQILDGHPVQASESLFEHRLQFQDRTVRNGAALMNSIARWRTSPEVVKSREAAFLYRSIAAVEPESEWLGPSGQLLLGQAMHEIDLDERMADLYSRVLQQQVSKITESKMKLALAQYWYSNARITEAKSTWREIYAGAGSDSGDAGMRLAQVALDEMQPVVCIDLCREMLTTGRASRADLLKLAGRAYEQAGQPILAAQCYAGQIPSQ